MDQAFSLSDQAKVSIITCGPGKQIYSVFGHSAIRISDDASRTDIVYNYGVFNFNTPNFIIEFLKGNLMYKLKKSPFDSFKKNYIHYNRSVYEQVLNLTPGQVNELSDLLEDNAKPENKFYVYDFYSANCSSKIVDKLTTLLGDHLIYSPHTVKKTTFRQSLHQICANHPWLLLGFDFLEGRKADQTPSSLKEIMNLPDILFDELKNCYVRLDAKSMVPLVTQYTTIYQSTASDSTDKLTPKMVFWILFVIALYITFTRASTYARFFDGFVFTSLGIIGLLTFVLWSFSNHDGFSFHVSAIWINPLHFVVACYILFNPKHSLIKKYFFNYNIIFLGMLFYRFLYPEEFNPHIFPLMLTIFIRSLDNSGKANFQFNLFRRN